jgi:glycosyltransferase involved in cell wall biosynthesis
MALAKVLILAFDVVPAPDGRSVRVESMLRALQGRYDVDLLTPRVGDLPHVEMRSSARVLRVPLGKGHLHAQVEAFARAVRRQMQSEDYRIVHLCDPRVGGPVCELAAARGARIIFEPLGTPLLDLARTFPRIAENAGLAGRLRAAERLALAMADVVLVATQAARRYVAARGGFDAKVTVLPGAVNLAAFGPTHVAPVGTPRVVYVGELAPWQGTATLLEAAREVLRVRRDVRFAIPGPAPAGHREEVAARLRSLGLEGAVEIRDAVPHARVPDLLAQADVCVVPSLADERAQALAPFAMKAAEAMATGRAVVLSRVPAHLEVAADGDEALFFPAGDAGLLAASLLRLLEGPDERTSLGQHAHARARETVSLSVYREKLLALYADLLGEGALLQRFADVRTVPRGQARP